MFMVVNNMHQVPFSGPKPTLLSEAGTDLAPLLHPMLRQAACSQRSSTDNLRCSSQLLQTKQN